MRLPKFNFFTFLGKYEWLPFFDSFNSVIHAHALFSNVQKFQYFKSALTDAAGNIVSSIEIFDANYAITWDLFRRRYKRAELRAFIDLSSMTRESFVELRKIMDNSFKHLRAFQALKCPIIYWNDLLVHILS